MTPTQRAGYLQHLGYVLFLMDRPHLQYHFGKLQDADVENLLSSTATNPRRQQGWQKFIRQYGLNEEIDPDAAREFLAASKAGRVPRWALSAVDLPEIKEAAAKGR